MTDPSMRRATRRTMLALAPGLLAGCSLGRRSDSPIIVPVVTSGPPSVSTSPIPSRDAATPASAVVAEIPVGAASLHLAVAGDGTLYVTDALGGKVIVVVDRQVIKTIDVGLGVGGVATAADGRAAVTVGDQVKVIKNFEVTDTIQVGGDARRIVVGTDGTGYVSHFNSPGAITVLREGQLPAKIPVEAYPTRLAVAPDNTLYVAHDLAGVITQINQRKVTRTIQVPTQVSALAVDPEGTLYASSLLGVHVIKAGRVTSTIDVGRNGGAGALAIGNSGYGYVSVGIDRAVKVLQNQEIVGKIPVNNSWNISQIAMAPDGTGYLGSRAASVVSVLA